MNLKLAGAIAGLMFASVPCFVLADAGQVDDATGEIMAQSCFGCHATDSGADSGDGGVIPPIAALSAQQLLLNFRGLRDGTISSTVMMRILKGYTDAEMKLLAKYFSRDE